MYKVDYIASLNLDAASSNAAEVKFYSSKSEQQRFLESLLQRYERERELQIADICCGTGHVTYFLSSMFPSAKFTLVDLNESFLDQAKQTLEKIDARRFQFLREDLYALPEALTEQYDIVVCWQTLSWLEDYKIPMIQLLRLLKPGGRLYASLLLNTQHDVDILARVVDYTRESSTSGLTYCYNTYSSRQFAKFLDGRVRELIVHPFEIGIDLLERPLGLGTYTVALQDGHRLQISAGMLMNWVIIEVVL